MYYYTSCHHHLHHIYRHADHLHSHPPSHYHPLIFTTTLLPLQLTTTITAFHYLLQ